MAVTILVHIYYGVTTSQGIPEGVTSIYIKPNKLFDFRHCHSPATVDMMFRVFNMLNMLTLVAA